MDYIAVNTTGDANDFGLQSTGSPAVSKTDYSIHRLYHDIDGTTTTNLAGLEFLNSALGCGGAVTNHYAFKFDSNWITTGTLDSVLKVIPVLYDDSGYAVGYIPIYSLTP